ncbi:MAG: hypothetical protein HND38_02555 [Planctomycetes bacterium]|nr:hypothetical protein [Planctomycetota bacterium]
MTRESTSISKISRPRITGIYPRKRLFRLMDAGLDYPVTWISAPAGSGKTTFIASYLDTHKLPFLWYQADASDADIATFFYYMGMAAKKAVPRKRPLPLLTSEYLPNISTFIRRYFETLYGRLPQPFFIIFDNYQDVPADASFHDMIVQGLDIIPDGIHVVVISRADPPHHFARLCANNRCNIIGWDEIRCTLDEFKEITRMKMPKKLTNEKVDLLYARMEGWVAGLVLMMEHAKSGYFDGALPAELTHGRVFDYFANEIFEKAGEETRIFLLKTAFLPMITVQMAEKLTGIHTSGHILSRLIRENYFTVAHPQPEVAYQYHSLFREYLVTKASDTFDTEELNNVKISAAIILEESGQIEDAASLFCKAKEWDGLMQLILKHAESLILQGRSKTLEEWISSVPEDIREVTPWLLFWFGVCRFLYNNPAAGRTYFDKAFKHFHVQGDVTGAWLAWTYAVDTFFHEFENFSSLDAYIRVFEDLIQKNSVFPSSEVESRVIFCRFISMMLRQPDHPEIKIWAKRVFSLLQKCSNMNLRLQCGFYLTVYYVWIGDFTNAGILVDILCKQVHLQTAPPLIRLLGKAAMIFYEWNTGSTGLCLQHISEVIEYTYRTGVHVWNLHLLSSGACAALNDGDIKTAIRLLEQIEPNLPTARKIDICFYHHIIAVKDLIMGNLISASEHVQMEVRMHSEINAPFPMAIGKITMSQIYAAMGKYPEAVMQLALARQIGNWMKSKHIEYMCLLTEAYFALELGIKGVDELHNAETNKHLPFSPTHDECKESDGESQLFRSPFAKVYGGYGLEILRKAMTLGREQNFISCFLWRFDIMPRLCV